MWDRGRKVKKDTFMLGGEQIHMIRLNIKIKESAVKKSVVLRKTKQED